VSLLPPAPRTDPREILRWVRRMEIVTGALAIAFGVALWNSGWWHWVLIGVGVSGLLPWFGAATILRRAERDPSVLESDPARGRRRGRRVALLMVLFSLLTGAIIGYTSAGWSGATVVGAIAGASAALGAWLYLRWAK
jgi:hypothetical protein